MKPLQLLFAFCLLTLFACEKETITSELEKSYRIYLNFKQQVKGNYLYAVTGVTPNGYRDSTVIHAENGIIVKREYIAFKPDASGNTPHTVWTEDRLNLSSHAEGAAAITLDEVYEKAKNEWLDVDRKKYHTILETAHNGIISVCGHTHRQCDDGCFVGIRIAGVYYVTTLLPLKP